MKILTVRAFAFAGREAQLSFPIDIFGIYYVANSANTIVNVATIGINSTTEGTSLFSPLSNYNAYENTLYFKSNSQVYIPIEIKDVNRLFFSMQNGDVVNIFYERSVFVAKPKVAKPKQDVECT